MKLHLISSPALAAALFLAPLAASAQNSTLQPINTRFAQTQSKISVELSAGYFTDLELEEADGFDGWTAALEIVVPLKIISEPALACTGIALLTPSPGLGCLYSLWLPGTMAIAPFSSV